MLSAMRLTTFVILLNREHTASRVSVHPGGEQNSMSVTPVKPVSKNDTGSALDIMLQQQILDVPHRTNVVDDSIVSTNRCRVFSCRNILSADISKESADKIFLKLNIRCALDI